MSCSKIGGVFTDGFAYAGDLKLFTPSMHVLRILTNICKTYAAKYDIVINEKKQINNIQH